MFRRKRIFLSTFAVMAVALLASSAIIYYSIAQVTSPPPAPRIDGAYIARTLNATSYVINNQTGTTTLVFARQNPIVRVNMTGMSLNNFTLMSTIVEFKLPPAATNNNTVYARGFFSLLESEVNPMLRQVLANNWTLLNLHPYSIGEQPKLQFLHWQTIGNLSQIMANLTSVLAMTTTRMPPPAPMQTALNVTDIAGRLGGIAVNGPTAEVMLIRQDVNITAPGIQNIILNDFASMATTFEFTTLPASVNLPTLPGSRNVFVMGDFALLDSEVAAVENILLRSQSLDLWLITNSTASAIHNHMLSETPKMTFLHFSAMGDLNQIITMLSRAIFVTSIRTNMSTPTPPPNSTSISRTLYAGELYDANRTLVHGAFGETANNLSSPGPTLYLTSGDTVNLTMINVGRVGHSWAITNTLQPNATTLFNAAIGTSTSPIAPGNSSSTVFRVGAPGQYYYICPVPGHVALGMWGMVIVGNSNNAVMNLYAGELYDANNVLAHGAFALTANNLSSPGPTLYLTSGTTLNVTMINVGRVGHSWAITNTLQPNATTLFNAAIGTSTSPIAPGNSSSTVFRVGAPGQYYYICPVPGHVALGMWGMVVVIPNATSITPPTTPTPTPMPTATPTTMPSPTSTATITPIPTPTMTATPTATPTPMPTATPGQMSISLSAGEYNFGFSANSRTSPGPTLNLRVGDTVTVTVTNNGAVPHAWAITNSLTTGAPVLFGAAIGSASSTLQPGQTASVTFTVTQAGNFFYICPVPGHVALGMWGNVVVTA